ncbi:MAG: glycosyltransferase family 2 protein [Methanosphaera sp.]|nr:glycosyltransferase family 2 protein [Methanosphaera sp.]
MASRTKQGISIMNTVCAVVVTYNRCDLLIKSLESLTNQSHKLDAIYIVDNNSTDNTQEILISNGYIEKEINSDKITCSQLYYENILIKYIHLPENIGGAGGFYYGVKQAHHDNYDWIFIMDDDAFPTKDCIKELVPYFELEDTVALASLKVDLDDNILYHHRGYFNFNSGLPIQIPITKADTECETKDIDMVSFVGLLVNRRAIDSIGYPKKEFFIHTDDLEYCIRLRSVGKIKLVNKSIIRHAEGSTTGTYKKKVLSIEADRRPYDKLWINYYMQRNLIWIGRKYSQNKLSLYITILKNYILTIIGILVFDDHKYRRIKFYTNAYIDGFKSRFDNNKPKEILYD